MGQAVYWLTQAVEQGHTYAQLLLERQDGPSLGVKIMMECMDNNDGDIRR